MSTLRVALLHVLPGVFIFLFYVAAAPALTSFGWPRVSALLLSFVVVGMPLQLAILKRQATKDGKRSIKDVNGLRRPLPFWLGGALVLASFAFAVGLLTVLPLDAISTYLAENVFWWFPSAARPSSSTAGTGVAVLVTLVLQVIIDGIANPIVEELYFRAIFSRAYRTSAGSRLSPTRPSSRWRICGSHTITRRFSSWCFRSL